MLLRSSQRDIAIVHAFAPLATAVTSKFDVAFKDCDDCPEMVVAPPGSFLTGDLQGVGDFIREIDPRRSHRLEHCPVLWGHLMGQSGAFGQARRAGRDAGHRASAATQPMRRSGPPKAGFFGPVAASRFSSDARHRISKRSSPRDKTIPLKWSHKTG